MEKSNKRDELCKIRTRDPVEVKKKEENSTKHQVVG